MKEKFIKQKTIELSEYPAKIRGDIYFRIICTFILVILLTVFAIVERQMFLLILAAIVLALSAIVNGYQYYVLTRDLCYIVEGICTEIRNGGAVTKVLSKVFGSVSSSSIVIESQGNKFIIPRKGLALSHSKVGDKFCIIFVETALQQNMSGEYTVSPMFTVVGDIEDAQNEGSSEN